MDISALIQCTAKENKCRTPTSGLKRFTAFHQANIAFLNQITLG